MGSSIIALQLVIKLFSGYSDTILYLTYLIPFIPPFFITRIAIRINKKKAEYDFVKDAAPMVFMAFPKKLNKEYLLKLTPDMVSNSSSDYLGAEVSEILKQPILHKDYLADPKIKEKIIDAILVDFNTNGDIGSLRNFPIKIKRRNEEVTAQYFMYSVLKKTPHGYKWQGTLFNVEKGLDILDQVS
ncbi:MAG: hypothetical protein HOO06_13610 [Bdellovibrionaceae bacterium]|nr:hypothetical protein [Pseudobdellovibrionaceae bacterium]